MAYVIILGILIVLAVTVGRRYWQWIVGAILIWIAYKMLMFSPMLSLIIAIGAGIYFYMNSNTTKTSKREKMFKEWVNQPVTSNYTYVQITELLERLGRSLPFYGDDMPLGRAEYFASSFDGLFSEDDTVYGFYPVRSLVDSELREYGLIITNRGIGLATQTITGQGKNEESHANSTALLFSGLWYCNYDEPNNLITIRSQEKEIQISTDTYSKMNFGLLIANVERLINSGFTHDLYTGAVDQSAEQEFDQELSIIERNGELPDNDQTTAFNQASQQAENQLGAETEANAIKTGVTAQSAINSANNLHNIQINQMVNGRQGHGVAAEYANSVADGGYLTNSKLVGQDNAKHGADRLSFGKKVQVKTSVRLDSNGQLVPCQ